MRGSPLELERAGWRVLAGAGDVAAFYDDVLAEDVRFVLPGGMVLDGRAVAVAAMSGPPWDDYELSGERAVVLGDHATAVVYRATATRGDLRYDAWFTSIYAGRDEDWRLVLHQQTPV